MSDPSKLYALFQNGWYITQDPNGNVGLFNASGVELNEFVSPTKGKGHPQILGLDNRSGITAVDGSAITLFSVPAAVTLGIFRISIEIDATAFTSGTATYTGTWTENAVSQTAVVTATALNVVTGIVRLMMPDASTSITVQLTGVFVATVRISAVVERLA